MVEMANGDLNQIDGSLVVEAARQSDITALGVVNTAARYMGLGLINVNAMFLPEVIVLSGGVMKSIELFMPVIHKTILEQNVMLPTERIRIVSANLGYQAGIYGAAYSILKHV